MGSRKCFKILFIAVVGTFVFGFRYQISDKNKNKRFRSEVDLEPVKSASAVPSV